MVHIGYRLTDQYVQRYRYKYQYMYVRVHVYGNAYPEYQNLYIRVYERRTCIQVLVRAAAEARPIQYYSSMLTGGRGTGPGRGGCFRSARPSTPLGANM